MEQYWSGVDSEADLRDYCDRVIMCDDLIEYSTRWDWMDDR